ncbi:hypothetical protein LMJ38_34595 [Streptomyces sp. R1]|uniref:hypothetical protein n=1 Tax=unclassified Streptomyces TaxID=2593676 RepID=UPI001E3B8832|nr:hypothetical protein [Streptomyces sp. R1]MCC8341026.1 hypothetical protein [Streptomyces sp. R1]
MAGLITAAFAMTLATASSASAHYVYFSDEVWANADSSKCLYNRSEVSHGSSGMGYFRGDALAAKDVELWPADCTAPWERNVGQLSEGLAIYKWYVDANDEGSWLLCTVTDWYYNESRGSKFVLEGKTDGATIPPCGEGYYSTMNQAGVEYGGDWLGWDVDVYSGYHYLPDTTSVASRQQPTDPTWVAEDGTVDRTKAPARVHVAGKDGEPIVNSDGSLADVPFPGATPPGSATRASAAEAERTVTVEDGHVVETAVVPLKRPLP